MNHKPIETEKIHECPYGTVRDEAHMACAKLQQVTGLGAAMLLDACQAHLDAGGWDVPVEQVPVLAARITAHLTTRIIGGDAPEFQTSIPVVLEQIAAKLKDRLTPEERVEVWAKAVDYWDAMPEEPEEHRGGHPTHVVKEKALRLAKLWDIDLEKEID